jgi:flagellar biosynthetic protein FliR
MPSEFSLPLATLYSFALVLARVAGVLVFVPIPGLTSAPQAARAVLALSTTMALTAVWPAIPVLPGPFLLAGWMISEAGLGMAIGLLVGFLSEALGMFGQLVGLQAGYSFASTVDPTTNADSSIFVVLAQTVGGLLFFALGLHRQVLLVLARSLETVPPGALLSDAGVMSLLRLGGTMFSTGLRLAFPVIALLIMVDLALALLGRINAQLQLLSLAFPAKMLVALLMIAVMAGTMTRVYQSYASRLFAAAPAVLR